MGIHGSSSPLRGLSPSLPAVSKLIWDFTALGWLKSVLPLAMESLNSPPANVCWSTGCDIAARHVFDPLCLYAPARLSVNHRCRTDCLFLGNVRRTSRHHGRGDVNGLPGVNPPVFISYQGAECRTAIEFELPPTFFFKLFFCVSAFDMLSAWKRTAPCHSSSGNFLMCHSVSYAMNKHADVQRDERWVRNETV